MQLKILPQGRAGQGRAPPTAVVSPTKQKLPMT